MKPLIRAVLGLSLSVGSMALSLPPSVGQVPGSDGESGVRAHEDQYFDAREGSVAPSAERRPSSPAWVPTSHGTGSGRLSR
jgi:hypothetical protein